MRKSVVNTENDSEEGVKDEGKFCRNHSAALDGRGRAFYNGNAVRTCLRLKVDARRGRNDPRKSAKVR